MIELIILGIGGGLLVWVLSWYTVVPQTQAHAVVTPNGRFVVSPDEKIATDNRKTYFKIPPFIPFFGRVVRVMDMTVKPFIEEQTTYEKGQAQYKVKVSMNYRIRDVQTAAERFENDEVLIQMLHGIVQSGVRSVTVKYDVNEARANKQKMGVEINQEIVEDLQGLGLELINLQLVDFYDSDGDQDSDKVITNISRRREVEIESQTRQENAEKIKLARMKEAESEELASKREIEKDRVIGEQEQIKRQLIALKEKEAKDKEYDVIQVATIRQTQINKEQAIINANLAKETEAIFKDKKKLEGEGDRIRAEEQAKGSAASVRETGYAEADAKERLQDALNKFGDVAIRALVAEKIVAKDQAIGVATANALSNADLKVFSGGKSGEAGFDLAQLIASTRVGDNTSADALLNKLGVPNDLGFSSKEFGKGMVVGSKIDKSILPKKDGEQ